LLQYIQYIARNRYCPIGRVKRLCIRGDKFIVKVREESFALDTTQEITRRGLEKTYSNRDADTSGLIIAAVANSFLREALSSRESDRLRRSLNFRFSILELLEILGFSDIWK